MAEEAFALSPIAARPAVPGEADYDAIREAFMETARGRWFLAEYAKRNRTADTTMVLDAVTRLEANLAAQKQPVVLSMTAALGAIRHAVRQAKATAIEAMPRADSDETLTGARNGARIIREIAWTLRECGADTRICDLLDAQVKAIEAGQQSWTGNGRDDVLTSYDVLMQRIEQIAEGGAAPVAQPEPAAEPSPAMAEARTSVTPLFRTAASETIVETAAAVQAEPVIETQAAIETAVAHDSMAELVVEPVAEAATPDAIAESSLDLATSMAEAAIEPMDDVASMLDAETQHDLDVLDMVAQEMGALDPDDMPDEAMIATATVDTAPAVIARPDAAPTATADAEPVAMVASDTDMMTLAQIAEAALAPEPAFMAPEPAASLGAALIAHGVIADPAAPANDALAPIRKMTQAEKLAFFA